MTDDLWDGAHEAPGYLRVKRAERAPASAYTKRTTRYMDRPEYEVSRNPEAARAKAARDRSRGKATLETYRPGIVQSAYDAAERGLSRLNQSVFGENERDAAYHARRTMQGVKFLPEDVLGASELEGNVRRIAAGSGGPGDYMNAALMLAPEISRIPGVRSLAARGAEHVASALGDRAASVLAAPARYLGANARRFSVAPEYAVREEGPFLHVARTGVEPQIVPGMAEARGIDAMRHIMRDPANNPALRMANELSVEQRGVPLDEQTPVASLQRQSGISRAFRAAAEGSPEYKSAVFEAYGRQHPELVEQSGAQNYDQLTEAAYRALGKDVGEQFHRLPVAMQYHHGAGEYATPSAMFRDVLGSGNLNVYRGGDPHEFLHHVDPETGLNENEMFRAVHDYIGHVAPGSTFRPGGEEIAYAAHHNTLSPLARLALLSETRGQNSLVNFSPLNIDLLSQSKPLQARIEELRMLDRMRGQPGASAGEIADISRQLRDLGAQTQYAPQKAVLLPPEYLDPMSSGGIPEWLRPAIKPEFGTAPERAVHFSHTPDLTATDPSFYGTGFRGDDWAVRGKRGSPATKTSFYLGEPGTVRPEKVVADISPHAYETTLSNLYDIRQDPEKLVALARAYDVKGSMLPDLTRMVREYGYSGYRNPDFLPGQGAADVFDPVGDLRSISRGPEGYAMGGAVSGDY